MWLFSNQHLSFVKHFDLDTLRALSANLPQPPQAGVYLEK
jgi:hypothetical protein